MATYIFIYLLIHEQGCTLKYFIKKVDEITTFKVLDLLL